MTASGREATPVDAPEQHDERCEAEFITGPMDYSPCGCAERAAGREAKRDYGICPACLVDEGAPCVNDQQRPVPWIHEGRAATSPARQAAP